MVWYEPHGTLYGFQLSYDRFEYQRTLKWTLEGGYLHAIVNEGANDSPCLSFVSPTMTHGAEFPFEKVHTEFIRRTPQLDPELRDFINHHIMIFGLKQQAR